jgi:hypothetical protein
VVQFGIFVGAQSTAPEGLVPYNLSAKLTTTGFCGPSETESPFGAGLDVDPGEAEVLELVAEVLFGGAGFSEEVVFHGEGANAGPWLGIGKDAPFGAFAVEFKEVDLTDQVDEVGKSDLGYVALCILFGGSVAGVDAGVEFDAGCFIANSDEGVLGADGFAMGGEVGFDFAVGFVGVDAGVGMVVAGSDGENADVGADIDDGLDGWRGLRDAVAVVEEDLAEFPFVFGSFGGRDVEDDSAAGNANGCKFETTQVVDAKAGHPVAKFDGVADAGEHGLFIRAAGCVCKKKPFLLPQEGVCNTG